MKTILLIFQMLLLFSINNWCQWNSDTTQNNVICSAVNEQNHPQIISDDNDGGIIIWEDYRGDGDIYAQRISGNGNLLWQNNGVPVCNAVNAQDQIKIIKDNNGGAFIVWVDRRISSFNTNIFAQRIDNGGNSLWAVNGVPVCQAIGNQLNPDIIEDGTGGIIVTWTDFRNGSNDADVFAQRISPNGNISWQTDGVVVCDTTDDQALPQLVFVDDDTLGVIVVWEDDRNSNLSQRDIYAQRVDLNGNTLWQSNGKIVTDGANQQRRFKVTTSTDNDIIVAWEDYRSTSTGRDIWVQKFDKYGTKKWGNGINVSPRTGTQLDLGIASDNSNNIYLTYRDLKYGNWVAAQKLDENGNKAWTDSGVVIGVMSVSPKIIIDNSNNPILFYEDGRNSLGNDVYASKLDQFGNFIWQPTGIPVSTAPNNQGYISAIPDGLGGAIVVWEDNRTDTTDIYASRVYSKGSITLINENNSEALSSFKLSQNYPNPFNPSTKISWQSPVSGHQTLKVYDVLGNEVATLVDEYREAGIYEVTFDASGLPSGIYFYKLQAGEFSAVRKMILMK